LLNNILSINVTNFSNFTIENSAQLYINRTQFGIVNKNYIFYANYSNTFNGSLIRNATCNITVDTNSYLFIEGSNFYSINLSFNKFGRKDYSITCNGLGYDLVTYSDYINISDSSLVKAINFQPLNSNIPFGYLKDSGENFNNLLGYGWVSPPNGDGARDRDNDLSPSEEFDTLLMVSSTGIWELNVTNEKYNIIVSVGDPSFAGINQNVQVGGVSIISDESYSSGNWLERNITINITDNRLTLTFINTSTSTNINFIHIYNNSASGQGSSKIHDADNNSDGIISNIEMTNYIFQWKRNVVTISSLIGANRLWKIN